MAWVVDTSVVVDLVTGDPLFEPGSTACLQAHLGDGLVISPVTFVELGPGKVLQGLVKRINADVDVRGLDTHAELTKTVSA